MADLPLPDSVRNFNPAPAPADLAEMWDSCPRPPLTSYEAFIAEGVEAADEVREFERRRAGLMAFLYGDLDEAA